MEKINRRDFVKTIGIGASLSYITPKLKAANILSSQNPKNKPNIVLITNHDIGQHIGCYGVKTVSTPSIDGLANEGMRFENSFCSAPQCSPSRASIYTGRYPHSNGVMGLTHWRFAWDLNPGEKHLATLLKEQGYQTALAGVMHEARDVRKIGFDHLDLDYHNYTCDVVAEKAEKYLKDNQKAQKPFYLQIGFFEPHRPFDFGGAKPDDEKGVFVPPYLVDDADSQKEFAEYQGAIKNVDRAIGRIIRAVDKYNLRENTIFIYSADHGIPFPRAKCSIFDPGLQVPFIIRFPARGWTGGKVFKEMISNVDYLPTIMEAIGADIPENVQGKSFASLLDRRPYSPRKEIFGEMTYHEHYDPMRCIRTEKYKLIAYFSTAPFLMNPSQSYRPACITKEPPDPSAAYHDYLHLYDLQKDPLESKNLADDPAYSKVKKDLATRLFKWMKDTNDPLLKGAVTSPHHDKTLEILSLSD